MWKPLTAVAMLSLACTPPTETPAVPYAPDVMPSNLGIAGYAKVLCSAVFVSGRDLDEAKDVSGYFLVPDKDRSDISAIEVDEARKSVRVTLRGELTREARFYGDQGCIIHQENGDEIFFEPVPVRTSLPDAATQAWPMGDAPGDSPSTIDSDALEAAVDKAFTNPESLTAAFVVVHDGEIVAERYAHGAHKDMQLESWSMGKSLTATLVGRLVHEGAFGLDEPAPVPAWQGQDDPRRDITIRNLMNMSSGLHFIAPRDPDYTPDMGYPDHMFIYTGAHRRLRLLDIEAAPVSAEYGRALPKLGPAHPRLHRSANGRGARRGLLDLPPTRPLRQDRDSSTGPRIRPVRQLLAHGL